MKILLKAFALLVLLTSLTSCVASTQAVAVRPYPPRPVYYQPRPRVVVVPAPRPRTVIVTPARPRYYHYNARPYRYVRVR